MQGGFAETIRLAQGGEGGCSLSLVAARKGTGLLPGGISPHAPQTLLSFGEDGIVEQAGRFQMGAEAGGLSWIDNQGEFEQKGGGHRPFLLLFLLLALSLTFLRHLRSSFGRTHAINHRASILPER